MNFPFNLIPLLCKSGQSSQQGQTGQPGQSGQPGNDLQALMMCLQQPKANSNALVKNFIKEETQKRLLQMLTSYMTDSPHMRNILLTHMFMSNSPGNCVAPPRPQPQYTSVFDNFMSPICRSMQDPRSMAYMMQGFKHEEPFIKAVLDRAQPAKPDSCNIRLGKEFWEACMMRILNKLDSNSGCPSSSSMDPGIRSLYSFIDRVNKRQGGLSMDRGMFNIECEYPQRQQQKQDPNKLMKELFFMYCLNMYCTMLNDDSDNLSKFNQTDGPKNKAVANAPEKKSSKIKPSREKLAGNKDQLSDKSKSSKKTKSAESVSRSASRSATKI